jgi:hypothetical protein
MIKINRPSRTVKIKRRGENRFDSRSLGRSPRICYDDFHIRVVATSKRDYRILLESPFGTASAPFKLPFSQNLLLKFLEDFSRDRGNAQTPGAVSLEEVGQALFRSLFAGNVGELFRESLVSVEQQRDRGLRIRLEFDLRDPSLLPIAALPWELLWDEKCRDFLSRIRKTPIARYLDVPRPSLPPISGPLRVMYVMSSPMTFGALNLDAEWNEIKTRLKTDPKIEVATAQCSSLAGLRDMLLSETWHIVHFMGHAGFNRESGEGFLYFEDSAGNAQPVTGRLLGEHLKSFPDLRLVFINACHGASVPCLAGQDPFSGIATALVLAGVPAVIAMQGSISDKAASTFSANFYASLAAGDPIDAAVVEARLAILREQNFDWATPVLFTRIPDGDILGVKMVPEK